MILNILLTGEPGCGKTTIVQAVLEKLKIKAQGFYTSEIRAGKTRKGFQLHVLGGASAQLAHINKKGTYRVGPYGVDLKVMDELAVPALATALSQPAPLIVLDEIGKMECFSKKFRDTAVRCLDAPIPVLGTLQTFSHSLVNQILNRPDIIVIEVNPGCRDLLVDRVHEFARLQLKAAAEAQANRKKSRAPKILR